MDNERKEVLTPVIGPDYISPMAGYTKLWSSLIQSTVWREEMHVKVVWITMLALADQHGLVMASVPGLGDAARVSLDQCVEALERLSSPDKWSRTKDFEGRRIQEVDGGWIILNHPKYRSLQDAEERREKVRMAVQRHRRKRTAESEAVIDCNQSNHKQKQEAEAEAGSIPRSRSGSSSTPNPLPPGFVAAFAAYPQSSRNSKADALKNWHAFGLEEHAENVLAWIASEKQGRDWRKDAGAFIPGMQVWLKKHRADFTDPPPSGRHPAVGSAEIDYGPSETP